MCNDEIFTSEGKENMKLNSDLLANAIKNYLVDGLQDRTLPMCEAKNQSEYPTIIEISSAEDLTDGRIAETIHRIITGENNTCEQTRFKNSEELREFIGEMNNHLRDYTKMAKNFLRIKSTREKVDSLRGLVQLIEDECKAFLKKDSYVEWDYIAKDPETGVSREMTGAPDFEIYLSAFNNKEKRREFATLLDCNPFKEQGITFAELEIFVLHTAIKVELERAEKEFKCQTPHIISEDIHFCKRVSDEDLNEIYDGLVEKKMLCDNPTLEDFVYWHTGSGTRPQSPLKWATKNVCRYYVQQYLDSDWLTAEQCFCCKRGKINDLQHANNITKSNKEIIDGILKKVRQKSAKIKTRTD
jgi:hypothetical protein